MDVTSLLNSSTTAAGQQKLVENSGAVSRSRTPWDAGGYSLPINTIATASRSINTQATPSQMAHSAPREIHHDDSHLDIQNLNPTSPKHKSSDSRSSLSSSTSSSLQSVAHSRFSSISTIGSCHLLPSTWSVDGPSLKSRNTTQPLDSTSLDNSSDARPSPSLSPTETLDPFASVAKYHLSNRQTKFVNQSSVPWIATFVNDNGSSTLSREDRSKEQPGSPTDPDPLDTFASVAEHHLSNYQTKYVNQSSVPRIISSVNNNGSSNLLREYRFQERPGSPSDAVLIRRSPVLRVNTGEADLSGGDYHQPNLKYLSALSENYHGSTLPKSHKRCASAPDITVTATDFLMRESTNLRPRAEPTPPSSRHPDSASPTTTPSTLPSPDTPPSAAADGDANAVVCMYIPNCDTGSQPRKAISHIFGRNKMCTRLIPPHVWVHYCRKHYQRSRYRNQKEYAKLQCDLVQQQIRRVHEWSLNNMKNPSAGVVQDWGLAVRKRERQRLDDLEGANRKRNANTLDRNSDDGDENFDDLACTLGKPPVPATAVPDWLLDLCGKGYSTQEILEIFNRLHTEILNNLLRCFPDIEILPNITVGSEEPKSPKGYAKRLTGTNSGHRRSQSLGMAMDSDLHSPDRGLSQPTGWATDDLVGFSPVQKKRRPNERVTEGSLGKPMPRLPNPRMVEQPADVGRRIQQLAHCPVFTGITENEADEDNYEEVQPRAYHTPLPVSRQQSDSYTMATQAERDQGRHSSRRQMHNRSQSDMGSFGQGQMMFSTPSSSYFVDHQARSSNPYQQARVSAGNPTFLPSQHHRELSVMQHPTSPVQIQQSPGPGHARHQSTPMIQQTHSVPTTSCTQPLELHPNYRFTQNHTYTSRPHQVSETRETRDLYSARR